ncbi:MAG: phosphate ABC transporter permease subunit PstC [Anaerolineales bacterium]|nr:phosphate ABC transporter permease subunit PstC [Anaerolineales bacterium]
MAKRRKLFETIIQFLIRACGYSTVLFVAAIFIFLLQAGLPALFEASPASLLGLRWYPIESLYGLLPLLFGSLVVTIGAAVFSIPLGVATALFIAEVAPRWMREVLKPFVEILAGLPSVVLGFLGFLVLAPLIRTTLNLPTGLTALTGSILLAAMALPTIVSVAEDALDAVPKSYRDGALALGATKWQTIWRVTLPAARSGVLTAVMLGIGRAIGETMAVMMVTGNAPQIRWDGLFFPARTMTATIAAEMGEVAGGSAHYHMLFLVAILLFLISFLVNIIASSMLFRAKKRAERMLS